MYCLSTYEENWETSVFTQAWEYKERTIVKILFIHANSTCTLQVTKI